MHREHPELLLVAAVGRELAALTEEDDSLTRFHDPMRLVGAALRRPRFGALSQSLNRARA
jgi:hypothetical protein